MAEQSSDSVERLAEGARVELEDRKRLLRGGVICEEFVAFYYEYKSVDEVWDVRNSAVRDCCCKNEHSKF